MTTTTAPQTPTTAAQGTLPTTTGGAQEKKQEEAHCKRGPTNSSRDRKAMFQMSAEGAEIAGKLVAQEATTDDQAMSQRKKKPLPVEESRAPSSR